MAEVSPLSRISHKSARTITHRFLFAARAIFSEIYGDPKEHPQRESYWGNVNTIGPRSCYDEGKRVAETMMYSYRNQNKVDVRVARIFNTFGPRMHPNDGRVVSNFIIQSLQNKDITVYGEGEQTRSFQYVHDLVEGTFSVAPPAAGSESQPRFIFSFSFNGYRTTRPKTHTLPHQHVCLFLLLYYL